jgi:hypothetical protein
MAGDACDHFAVRGSAAAWRGSNFPQACRERVQDIPQVLKRISFVWAMRSGGILREHLVDEAGLAKLVA